MAWLGANNRSISQHNYFPLLVSSDGHYIVDSTGKPRPTLARTLWNVISLPAAGATGYRQLIDDTAQKGFTAIECRTFCHSGPAGSNQDNNPPFDGNGNLPFSKTLSGATYAGALDAVDSPDFSTPIDAYFDSVVAIVDYCATKGIFVHLFPSYMGFPGTDQGWDKEMQANGATKMQTYGAYIATRLKTRGNVMYMLGGDQGTFSTAQKAVLAGMHTGLASVSGQVSIHRSAEFSSPSLANAQTDYGGLITINSAYAFDGTTATWCLAGYGALPCFLDEGPYDEEGPDGDNFNAAATQPVRRFNWWAWLSCIQGYCTGNAFVWRNQTGYQNHMNTFGAADCARLNYFVHSIEWWRLVPSGKGSIGTLVTSGGGTIDTTSYVAAACTPLGDLWVAYLGTGNGGSITVDCTKMRGTFLARWFDPTNATYTAIGSFANTGTHVFTTPGNNSDGKVDWVLRLDA